MEATTYKLLLPSGSIKLVATTDAEAQAAARAYADAKLGGARVRIIKTVSTVIGNV